MDTLQVLKFDLSFLVTFRLLLSHADFLQCSSKPLLNGSQALVLKEFRFLHTLYRLLQKAESLLFMASFKMVKVWCRNSHQEHTQAWEGCRAIVTLRPLWREQRQLFCTTSTMNVQGKTVQLSYNLPVQGCNNLNLQ